MNIYDIQVALITKQYLEHIEKIKNLDVLTHKYSSERNGDFLSLKIGDKNKYSH